MVPGFSQVGGACAAFDPSPFITMTASRLVAVPPGRGKHYDEAVTSTLGLDGVEPQPAFRSGVLAMSAPRRLPSSASRRLMSRPGGRKIAALPGRREGTVARAERRRAGPSSEASSFPTRLHLHAGSKVRATLGKSKVGGAGRGGRSWKTKKPDAGRLVAAAW